MVTRDTTCITYLYRIRDTNVKFQRAALDLGNIIILQLERKERRQICCAFRQFYSTFSTPYYLTPILCVLFCSNLALLWPKSAISGGGGNQGW